MTVCCEKERTTRFCPDCGKPLGKDPVLELMRHVRKVEENHRKQVANHMDDAVGWKQDGDHEKAQRFLSQADRYHNLADQWKSWGDALAALIDKAGESSP